MKVIIAGGRDNVTKHTVVDALTEFLLRKRAIKEVVSGMSKGVDTTAVEVANSFGVKVKKFPADWAQWGRAAGPMRNTQMAEYADALIAVWDGSSRGTKDMISKMTERKKPVLIFYVQKIVVNPEKGTYYYKSTGEIAWHF